MDPEIINKLQEVFAPVAAKIGEGAAYGWEIVVRQQFVEGIIALLLFLAAVLLVGTAVTLALIIDWDNDTNSKESVKAVFMVISGICGFFVSFMSLLELFVGGGIGKLINPEYYALEFFITLGKSAI
jgi:hypothetical protein